ncbi:hypothetical protein [Streptomyces sp. NPDC002537]
MADNVKPPSNEKPYENYNWAMVVKADSKHPLAPGKKDGELLIFIQNASNKPQKLHSHIGLTYRTNNTPGRIVFTTPQPGISKSDVPKLNLDTPIDGYFADGLPGDKVFVKISSNPSGGAPESDVGVIKKIAHEQKVWSYIPEKKWVDGTEYTVTVWAELEGITSAASVTTFKATAPEPSVNIYSPGKEGDYLSPTSKIFGSYGGTVLTEKDHGITVTSDGKQLTVRQDYPVKGNWTAEPPGGKWTLGKHTIVAQAQNATKKSNPMQRMFEAVEIKPGVAVITGPSMVPAPQEFSIYKLPHLQGRVDAWQQKVGLYGPCDKVIITDKNKPGQEMLAKLIYDEKLNAYTWNLETEWTYSNDGVMHEVTAIACLGNERSDRLDEKSTTKFIMKTPRPDDNPLQFVTPKSSELLNDSRQSMTGRAQANTRQIVLSEKTTTGGIKILGTVATTLHDESPATWKWEPKDGQWDQGPHTVTAAAGDPPQESTINFTVGKPGPIITRPEQPAKESFRPEMVLSGIVPRGADPTVTIIDVLDNKSPVSDTCTVKEGETSFHYTPAKLWGVGDHKVTAKGTHGGALYEFEPTVQFKITSATHTVLFTHPVSSTGIIHLSFPDDDDTAVTIRDNGAVAFSGTRGGKSFDFPVLAHPGKDPWKLPWATGHHDLEVDWTPKGAEKQTDKFPFEIEKPADRQYQVSFTSSNTKDYIWVTTGDKNEHVVVNSGGPAISVIAPQQLVSGVWIGKDGELNPTAGIFSVKATLEGPKVSNVDWNAHPAAGVNVTLKWENPVLKLHWEH